MAKNTGTLVGATVRVNDSSDTYPVALSSEIKGAPRSVTDLTALYALSAKPDLLELNVTKVYVVSELADFRLIDNANIGVAAGWKKLSPQSGDYNTSQVTENASFLYFTAARVLATVAAGLSSVAGTPLATDNIITILSKFKNFYDNIGVTIRGIAITGVVFTTATTIAATDTLLVALGKLQAQLNNKQATMTIATDAQMQAGTNDSSYVTALRNATWWIWAKTQAQTFVGAITLGALSGTTNRMMQVDAVGATSAVHEILERKVSDSDVTTAIAGATFNSANNYTAVISPANAKIMFEGQLYYSGSYRYEASSDNVVVRIALG